MVYGQSEIIAKEVFLVERIDKRDNEQHFQHLTACVFLRPTQDNLRQVKELLASLKYKEYHLFYSNVTGDEYLRQLAECDEHSRIRTVSEYYADYYAITDNLFTLHVHPSRPLTRGQAYWLTAEKESFARSMQGIGAFFASIKRRPEIRLSSASELCKTLGVELTRMMREQNDIFNHPQPEAPLLLLCDRRDDPVTPLLTQWTYQAMVHEVLGIKDNRVSLKDVPGVDKASQEVVLSVKDDKFYKDSMFLNFGELVRDRQQ
jgi:vacuolar protein sorting-associated protein 45